MTSSPLPGNKQPLKVIIIGATSGLGRALAARYAADGCIVGITGRREELLKDFQTHALSLNQTRIFTQCFDVTGKENILHVKQLLEKTGGMDLLIYNSGYGEVSKEMVYDIDKKIVDTNVNGFVEIVNWAFNYFIKQGWGHIAATSSIGSNRGTSYAPAYSASKAFMSNYMEGLYIKARKLHSRIFITDIQPGFLNTKKPEGNKQFWVVPVEKAVTQIYSAIAKKKFRVYVSRRWWLIATLMKLVPISLYRKFG